MNKDQQLREVIKQYKAGIAFVVDDADEVFMYGCGTEEEIYASLMAAITDSSNPNSFLLKKMFMLAITNIITEDREDMERFFTILNDAIGKNDQQAKIININTGKE